jgi:hypothetical protein
VSPHPDEERPEVPDDPGALLGVLLAVASGLAGGEGRVGLAILLLVTAASTALAASYASVTLLLDQVKGRRTTGRRALLAGGLFLLTAMLMAMLAGAGG